MMKAVPLPSPKVMLSSGCKRYYGHLRLPLRPGRISSPYICQLSLSTSQRVSRATPHGFPCVSPLPPRKSICCSCSLCSQQIYQPSPNVQRVGGFLNYHEATPIGSLMLQPAGLLGSLIEPLSGNLMLQVTPHTSLLLHG